RRRGLGGPPAVYLPDKEKDGEGDDKELNHRIKKYAVVQRGGAGLLSFSQRGGMGAREIQKEVAEVNLAHHQADKGHDDVVDERVDDFAEGRANDDPNCQVEDIALHGKFFEVF